MELLLVRHARPVRRESTQGPADPELSDEGHAQARLLADYLAVETITAVFASPLQRARQTASPMAAALGIDAVVDEGLAEYDRLADSYIPLEELKAADDPRYRRFLAGERDTGDETPAEFRDRVVACVEQLIGAHAGGRIVVVCHGGVINAYLAHVLGLDVQSEFFFPNYTSIHRVIAARSGERSVASLNEIAHLRGTGARPGLLD